MYITARKHTSQYVVDTARNYLRFAGRKYTEQHTNIEPRDNTLWNLSIRGRITRRGSHQGTVKRPVSPEAPTRRGMNIYSQLSGLEDVGFNDFIKDDD